MGSGNHKGAVVGRVPANVNVNVKNRLHDFRRYHCIRRTADNHPPLTQHDDLMRAACGKVEVMQYDDQSNPAGRQFAGNLQRHPLVRKIKRGSRFIKQQKASAFRRLLPNLRKHTRQMHALLFTAGEPRIFPVSQLRCIDTLQRSRYDFAIARYTRGMGCAPEHDHLGSSKWKIQY